jgi:endonuclease YncB( thermonuclease family)
VKLLLATILLLASSSAWAEEWQGAARVIDGDTVIIGGTRLRLISLDAPEGKQTCRDSKEVEYDCGQSASHELERLIGGREIGCSGDKRDRYGRPLVVCFAGSLNLNAELVRSGWAISFLGRDYEREEAEARTAKRGLWEGTFLTPQEWRRESRKGQTPRAER